MKRALVCGGKIRKTVVECSEVIKEFNPRIL